MGPLAQGWADETDDITKPWPIKQIEKPKYMWGKDKIPVASSEVPTVFGYDEHDPRISDHYNAACVEYPWADRAYFMFPSHYRHFPKPPVGKYDNDGLLDIQMAVSRDGVEWGGCRGTVFVAGHDDEIDMLNCHGDWNASSRRQTVPVLHRFPVQSRNVGYAAGAGRRIADWSSD